MIGGAGHAERFDMRADPEQEVALPGGDGQTITDGAGEADAPSAGHVQRASEMHLAASLVAARFGQQVDQPAFGSPKQVDAPEVAVPAAPVEEDVEVPTRLPEAPRMDATASRLAMTISNSDDVDAVSKEAVTAMGQVFELQSDLETREQEVTSLLGEHRRRISEASASDSESTLLERYTGLLRDIVGQKQELANAVSVLSDGRGNPRPGLSPIFITDALHQHKAAIEGLNARQLQMMDRSQELADSTDD